MISIIKRNECPEIKNELIQNKILTGIDSSFANQNNTIDPFLSINEQGLSINWISLQPNQTVQTYKHSRSSIFIVFKGTGTCIADYEADLEEGDTVLIPAQTSCSFKAKQPMTCLFIQSANEHFHSENDIKLCATYETTEYFDEFVANKKKFEDKFRRLCHQIQLSLQTHDSTLEKIFYGYLKRWSQCFQQILFLRQSLTTDTELAQLFSQHLEEEIGHDQYFDKFFYEKHPDIEVYCAWFERKIQLVSDTEKAIIVHTVLETAGEIFANIIQSKNVGPTTTYLELHANLDDGHADICTLQIEEFVYSNPKQANDLCSESWEMFITLFSTILHLSMSSYKIQVISQNIPMD